MHENSGSRGPTSGNTPAPLSPPGSPTRQPTSHHTPAQSPQFSAGQHNDGSLQRKTSSEELRQPSPVPPAALASGAAPSRPPPSPTSPSKSVPSTSATTAPTVPSLTVSAQPPSATSWKVVGSPCRTDGRLPTTPAASRGHSPSTDEPGILGADDADDADDPPYRRPRAISLSSSEDISEFRAPSGIGNIGNLSPGRSAAAATWGVWGNRNVWNNAGESSPKFEGTAAARRTSFGGFSDHQAAYSSSAGSERYGVSSSSGSLDPSHVLLRQARSMSFSVGQCEGDFFSSLGTSPLASSSSPQPPPLPFARRGSATLSVPEDSDLPKMDGIAQHLAFRGSLLPSMSEEGELSAGTALPSDHTTFTLPRLRSRSKSSAAACGVNGLDVVDCRRHSLAPLSSASYSQSAGVVPRVTISSSVEDVCGNDWKGEQLQQQEGSHRRSITTPSDYWPPSGPTGEGEGDLLGPSPVADPFERVRSQRRLSLHPAFAGYGSSRLGPGGYPAGGLGSGAVGGELRLGYSSVTMSTTGAYGDYSYLESSQGMGTLNRMVEPEFAHLNQRRHSVAGPTLSFANSAQSRYLSDAMESLRFDDSTLYGRQSQATAPPMQNSSLDDYFDNDKPRAARVAAAAAAAAAANAYATPPVTNATPSSARSSPNPRGVNHHNHHHNEHHPGPGAAATSPDSDVMHLGRGIPLHAVPHAGPLYIVEFKAGRSDLFYLVPEAGDQVVKRGDLVIVEADRGKDLGKVVNDDITPVQVQMLQQRQAEAAAVAEMGMVTNGAPAAPQQHPQQVKELHPKRLYRLAQPAEVTMLVAKNQDESKAMLVCQTKVRQKNLPMEVVDAEYQWDRRKLTFYFIAERRIDFRELVRELFKTYKTRIWMCAVNPGQTSGAGGIKP